MQIIHKLTLDTAKQGVQAVIPVTANDSNSHLLMISFCTDGSPVKISEGMSAVLYALKPDKTEIMNSCICYGENGAHPNTVVHTLSADTVSVSGTVTVRIIVGDGYSTYYSPRFALRVEQNEFLDSDVTSSSEYSQLIALAANASEHALDAQAWACGERAGKAVSSNAPQYHNNAKYYADQAKNTLKLDSSMSDSSQNAVQNKVIKAYVDNAIAESVTDALSSAV